MIKNIIIKKILVFSLLFVAVFASASSTMAENIPKPDTLGNLNKTANKAYTGTDNNANPSGFVGEELPTLVGKVIGTGLSFLGVIFLILMIYGGFLWMLARGDGSQVSKAKDLIEAAIIGLVIVTSAYAITAWLGQKLTTGV